jgi:hypothetical protein
MAEADQPKAFRTLRGFLNGEEPDEANYFHFSAWTSSVGIAPIVTMRDSRCRTPT